MPMQNLLLLAEVRALGVCPCRIITFGRTEYIGCVLVQNSLVWAELKAFGVCPCTIHYLWQNRRHWLCAHAEFITCRATEGIGCVSMQNFLRSQD